MLEERGEGVDRVAAAGPDLEVQVRAGELPVEPTVPMTSPPRTVSPTLTANEVWWQNHSSVPSSRVRTVLLP